jgi:hypothetical protein
MQARLRLIVQERLVVDVLTVLYIERAAERLIIITTRPSGRVHSQSQRQSLYWSRRRAGSSSFLEKISRNKIASFIYGGLAITACSIMPFVARCFNGYVINALREQGIVYFLNGRLVSPLIPFQRLFRLLYQLF